MDVLLFFSLNKSCFINIEDQLDTLIKITNLKEGFYYLDIKIDIEVEK